MRPASRPQSLERSIGGANAAAGRYIGGGEADSARRSNAAEDYDYRAIRHCFYARSPWGDRGYAC